jgi:peptidylprolyl isomerase
MIIPLLIILLGIGLFAGDEDVRSASNARESDGVVTGANGSPAGSVGVAATASEVGKTRPKIKFSPGSEPSRLEVTDLVVGTGAEATSGSDVTVHYVIVLSKNGQENEASWGREPYSFELGSGTVTPGWERGIVGMREGGRRELAAPSELAYGKAGTSSGIGPNEDLFYVIDLLKVKPASAQG